MKAIPYLFVTAAGIATVQAAGIDRRALEAWLEPGLVCSDHGDTRATIAVVPAPIGLSFDRAVLSVLFAPGSEWGDRQSFFVGLDRDAVSALTVYADQVSGKAILRPHVGPFVTLDIDTGWLEKHGRCRPSGNAERCDIPLADGSRIGISIATSERNPVSFCVMDKQLRSGSPDASLATAFVISTGEGDLIFRKDDPGSDAIDGGWCSRALARDEWTRLTEADRIAISIDGAQEELTHDGHGFGQTLALFHRSGLFAAQVDTWLALNASAYDDWIEAAQAQKEAASDIQPCPDPRTKPAP